MRYKLRVPEDFSHDHVTIQVAIESTTFTPEQITDLVGTPWDEVRHIGDPRGKTGKTRECNVWRILNRKKLWGTLTGVWVPHEVRDQVVDFVRCWSEKTEIGIGLFIVWLGVTASKFYSWRERYGKANEHNAWVPRDFWLEDWEKKAIVDFHLNNPLEGYRRLTFMMLDRDVVAVSPSSVWRVLGQEGLLSKWNGKPSKKGNGFAQPPAAHEHWHIDVSYLNISGTFY